MGDGYPGGCWFGCEQEEKRDQHRGLRHLPYDLYADDEGEVDEKRALGHLGCLA